ncbi:MAG: hypothetical protein M0006_05675 [Magnetospirillum sp.]|nr:hypothetical protein [Magnetospirillum sp.]
MTSKTVGFRPHHSQVCESTARIRIPLAIRTMKRAISAAAVALLLAAPALAQSVIPGATGPGNLGDERQGTISGAHPATIAYNFPLLNEGNGSSSPQVRNQPNPIQILGVPQQKLTVLPNGHIPGLPPGYPTEDIVR